MPTAVACPGVQADMDDWTDDLGGWNFGIVGAYDGSHPTGFHRAGFEVPTTDYSRRHDPGVPYNLSWCCAGDYAHKNVPELRARHATLLGRLRANDPQLWMVDEFIGKPWPDLPVYYWARWNGVQTLKIYTGAGHGTWSHVSVRRSVAQHRAYLWRPYSAIGTRDMELTDAFKVPNFDNDSRLPSPFENTTVGTALGVAQQRSYQAYRSVQALDGKVTALTAKVNELAARPPVQATPVDAATLATALQDPAVVGVLAEAFFQAAQRAENE